MHILKNIPNSSTYIEITEYYIKLILSKFIINKTKYLKKHSELHIPVIATLALIV